MDRAGTNNLCRDVSKKIPLGTKTLSGNILETSTLLQSTSPGGRRPGRPSTTLATAGVQRRRVIKKHIQQKYLLCGFAIHVHKLIGLLISSLTLFFILFLAFLFFRNQTIYLICRHFWQLLLIYMATLLNRIKSSYYGYGQQLFTKHLGRYVVLY